MKKLFTLCAVAVMALTTSAQQTDVSKGSMFVGITNAMDIMDEEVDMTFTVGYAVQDGLLIMLSSGQDQKMSYTDGAEIMENGAEIFGWDGTYNDDAVDATPDLNSTVWDGISFNDDAVLGDDPSTKDVQETDFVIEAATPDLTAQVWDGVTYNDDAVDATPTDPVATGEYEQVGTGTYEQVENGLVDHAERTLNLHVRYFRNGYYAQLNMNDINDATGLEPEMTLGVGAMYNVGAIDGLYIDPNMTLGRDSSEEIEMSFNLGLGMRF